MIQRLGIKTARSYLRNNYGAIRHDLKAFVGACRLIAKKYNISPSQVFHFMIENEPINELYTHSYNFNSRAGRDIKYDFEYEYYKLVNKK